MRIPNVAPLLDSATYCDNGIDVHELCALVALHALIASDSDAHYPAVMDELAETAWRIADHWYAARRNPIDPQRHTPARPRGDASKEGGAE